MAYYLHRKKVPFMNIPPPITRKCEGCENLLELNLYRLDSSICRYCESGAPIPKRLQKEKVSKSEIDDSAMKNNEEEDENIDISKEKAYPIESSDQLEDVHRDDKEIE